MVDGAGRILTSTVLLPQEVADELDRAKQASTSGQLAWHDDSAEHITSFWSPFLRQQFFAASWTVMLHEPLEDLQAPVAGFRRWLLWVTLGAVWLVTLVSLVQIRRNLGPLDALREGTQRIAARDFTARVAVTSTDEFRDLADSFNGMADHLGKQFDALSTMNDINQAVLSQLKTTDIVGTALTRVRDLVVCDELAIGVAVKPARHFDVHQWSAKEDRVRHFGAVELEPEDLEWLQRVEGQRLGIVSDTRNGLRQMDGRGRAGARHRLTLPLKGASGIIGFVEIARAQSGGFDTADVEYARRVCDQIAVALSNAGLVENLDHPNAGMLLTLARVVDAKSPWTAGHSERVTAVGIEIGRVLGLSDAELASLRRGGLLHDIGKVGVPAEILDKPGRLTPEETEKMRAHVLIGARILEPLDSFADALPIVLEHHEWFNGEGYPYGKKGEELTVAGRIFGVADVFDAMTSERPYRQPLPRSEAIALIVSLSGRQFDPVMVDAFLKVMARVKGTLPGVIDSTPLRISA